MDKADSTPSGFGRSQWIATGLLLAVPVAPILKYVVRAPPVWIFAAGAVAIAVLADWIRRATEQAAKSLGPAIGGLMTVSFGSIAEIVLALFVLAAGNAEVVKAQITGSILGTSLLAWGWPSSSAPWGASSCASSASGRACCRACSSSS